MALQWMVRGDVVTPEVTIWKLKKMTEVDTKLQKRISGETGDK